jgi:hypothetical protein
LDIGPSTLIRREHSHFDDAQSPGSVADFSSTCGGGDFSSPTTPGSFGSYVAPPFSPAPAPAGATYDYQPPPGQLHESTLLINKILQMQQHQNAQLEEMRFRQRRLFETPQQEEFIALDTEQRQLLVVIDQSIKELEDLLQNHLLMTNELFRVSFLQNELTLQRRQLELYHFELQQLVGSNPGKPYVSIAYFYLTNNCVSE